MVLHSLTHSLIPDFWILRFLHAGSIAWDTNLHNTAQHWALVFFGFVFGGLDVNVGGHQFIPWGSRFDVVSWNMYGCFIHHVDTSGMKFPVVVKLQPLGKKPAILLVIGLQAASDHHWISDDMWVWRWTVTATVPLQVSQLMLAGRAPLGRQRWLPTGLDLRSEVKLSRARLRSACTRWFRALGCVSRVV